MSIRIRISLALLTSLAVLASTTATSVAAGHRAAHAHRASAWRPRSLEPALRPRMVPLWASVSLSGSGSSLVGYAPTGNGPSTLAVDPATHTIYVANGNNANGPFVVGGNTVSVIDSRHCNGQEVSRCKGPWPTITVGNLPSTVAIDQSSDTVYVTNSGDNTVSVFNGATCNALDTAGCGQTAATVPVGPVPIGIFADSANHTVYVANFNNLIGDTVSMIDSATCNASDLGACPTTEPPTLTIGSGPGDVDVDPATHTVYVAVSGGVSVFDADTCNSTVQTGCAAIGTLTGDPMGVISAKVDSSNSTLYTANFDNTVSAFDLRDCNASDLAGCATDTPGTVTPFPNSGFEHDLWLAVDAPLHTVYVVYQKDDALLAIDTYVCNGAHLGACATLTPPEIHTGTDPESIALDPLTQSLYTANQVDNDVSVIDATRCDAKTTSGCRARVPEVPVAAAGLAADPAVATTYVANGPNTSTVSMLDTSTCNAHRPAGCSATPPTVTLGTNPLAVAVDRRTHTVYVANQGSGATGSVSVIDARSCNASDTAGCANVQTLQVPGGNPDDIAVNPRTDTIYVATITSNGPDLLSVFNGATCNATSTVGCSQTPVTVAVGSSGDAPGNSSLNIAINRDTNTIYASNVFNTAFGEPPPFLGNTVYVINGASCDAADTTGCGQAPATVTIAANPPVGSNPSGIAVDQDTNTIYTANIADGEHPGTVSVINGATCNGESTPGCAQTPATAPAGFGANGIAVDATSNHVYATNVEDTSVTTINGNTCNRRTQTGCNNAPTQPIVGDYPTSISVDPQVDTAYVADIEGVSVMPLTP